MKEILVDQAGYDQYLSELEYLKQKNNDNASLGSKAYSDAVGDGWHDNFAFEESMRESRSIALKIDNMLNDKKYLKIVENNGEGDDVVKIGDKLRIKVEYSFDDHEVYDVILTGKYIPDSDSEITEITLNSPIGKAIFLKPINEKIVSVINGKKIKIEVLKKY